MHARVTRPTSAPRSSRLPRARLTAMGVAAHAAVELGERQVAVIGASPDAELRLCDDTVSDRHFEIRSVGDAWLLVDLGSTNGTRVDGVRVREAWLDGNVTINAGRVDLSFALLGDEVMRPLSSADRFGDVLGVSTAMRQLFAVLERSAMSDATLLLDGESGTGKELIAENVHARSPRRDGPFVVIDCSAIPVGLIESELFGCEKGAYTGADQARTGAIEHAHGGTLFLDEMGELPLDVQPKFLRALERRQVKRVGSSRYIDVDVRVIAATHRDLAAEVERAHFRRDLYYRLAVVRVTVPPLRQRIDDIEQLARHFATLARPGVDPGELLTPSVVHAFRAYPWPGNVRELRNAIERMLALGDLAPPPGSDDSGGAMATLAHERYREARRLALEQFEQQYARAVLELSDGVVARAARRAGISRQMFYRLLQPRRR